MCNMFFFNRGDSPFSCTVHENTAGTGIEPGVAERTTRATDQTSTRSFPISVTCLHSENS